MPIYILTNHNPRGMMAVRANSSEEAWNMMVNYEVEKCEPYLVADCDETDLMEIPDTQMGVIAYIAE